MSLTPNAFGAALGSATPFMALNALGTPFGTHLLPGGRVAAYVRSTGRQDLDDNLVSDNLVQTIDAGLARCRSGQNDVVYVLPGHTESFSAAGSIFANLVDGAQIIGCGVPGASNNPTITLTGTSTPQLVLNKNGVTVQGLNIKSAAALTADVISITGAWVTVAGCFISFTGVLGAVSAVSVVGAAGPTLLGNHIVCNSTNAVIDFKTTASTNIQVVGNLIRQAQGTTGGIGINLADLATTGFVANNYIQTATNGTPVSLGIVQGTAAKTGCGVFNNLCTDSEGGGGIKTPADNDGT